MTVVVAVVGGPGSGKSTLCSALAQHYTAAGRTVDHFEEEEILSRPDFSAVSTEFADGAGRVAPQTLIEAFAKYVQRSVNDGADLVITDALIPFIPSLVAWGHSKTDLERILAELDTASAGVRVVVVLLVADPAVTLPRAVEREGSGWLDGYIAKLSRWPGTSHVVSPATAVDQLRYEIDLTRELISRSSWDLVEVDAMQQSETLVKMVDSRLSALSHD